MKKLELLGEIFAVASFTAFVAVAINMMEPQEREVIAEGFVIQSVCIGTDPQVRSDHHARDYQTYSVNLSQA